MDIKAYDRATPLVASVKTINAQIEEIKSANKIYISSDKMVGILTLEKDLPFSGAELIDVIVTELEKSKKELEEELNKI